MTKKKFTFDDILLAPDYSSVEHGEVDIKSNFFHCSIEIPIISSPMDTITGYPMMKAMYNAGGIGIHHRYCDPKILESSVAGNWVTIAVSPSMGIDFIEMLVKINSKLIAVLDVAHGYTSRNLDFCLKMKRLGVSVVSGNIATKEAAQSYLNNGINYLRVGVGSGSVCSTRLVTGVGYPQGSAISEINTLRKDYPNMRIISDGGHRNSGDVVKALALGADFVMLGGMLAGTTESEGFINGTGYRGMASEAALSTRKQEFFVEGIEKDVAPKGPVAGVLKQIKEAIEEACYYTGSRNLSELRESEIIFLSNGSMKESYVR